MQAFCSFIMFLGRLMIGAIFLWSGINKVLAYETYAKYMKSNDALTQFLGSQGMEYIPFLLVGAAIIEIVGALSLILGWKARWGALLLFLYLIPVTYFFHQFWVVDGLAKEMQMINFFKNLAIMGGLLYVVSAGSGSCATKE